MTEAFVDSDVIVRLLSGDDPLKQQAAATLFAAVERGELRLHAPDTVIADAVYVLVSPHLYHMPRLDAGEALASLVRLPNLSIENKRAVLRALEIFGQRSLDFGDAMIIATMQLSPVNDLYAYDHDFNNIDGVNRLEPAA